MTCWRQNDATCRHLSHRKVTVSDCMPISLHKMEIWFLVLIQGGRERGSRWVFNSLYKDFDKDRFSLQAVQIKITMIDQQTRCSPDSWAAASVRAFSPSSHELPWLTGETFNQPFSGQLEVNVNGKKEHFNSPGDPFNFVTSFCFFCFFFFKTH